jgi:hypothetical protein
MNPMHFFSFGGQEVWKPIKDYPNYAVSSIGRVKRIGGNVKGMKVSSQGLMSLILDKDGYLKVGLRNDEGRSHFRVHRLVALAFITNEHGKPEVNHKDSNRANNYVNNLEWVTGGENALHGYSHGNRKQKGSYHSQNILTESDIPVICKMVDEGIHPSEIAEKFGISRTTILNVKTGRTWKHVSR